MYRYPNDLGSMIRFRIFPKKRTLCNGHECQDPLKGSKLKVSGVGKGLTLRTSRTKHKNNPREDENQLGSVNGDLMMNYC